VNRRTGALLATAVAAAVVNLVGVIYFFQPIAENDAAGRPLVPPAVGLIVYVLLSVLVLDRVSRHMRSTIRAALAIAASQIILVSIDFVLRGERGIATGAASAVLILVTWTVMAMVYDKVHGNG
jgi:hypothetical protein